jgi:catechol 2,3-dioxygenase-like lactoylglutathione lyase family enzyme
MSVSGIAHINIRTLDIAATVRLYTQLLGFRYDGQQQVEGFARNWLYDQTGKAIIHLRELAPTSDSTGAVDHVALACTDMTGVVNRLKAEGIRFAARDNPTDDIVQVFLTDPNGVALELNFPLAGR